MIFVGPFIVGFNSTASQWLFNDFFSSELGGWGNPRCLRCEHSGWRAWQRGRGEVAIRRRTSSTIPRPSIPCTWAALRWTFSSSLPFGRSACQSSQLPTQDTTCTVPARKQCFQMIVLLTSILILPLLWILVSQSSFWLRSTSILITGLVLIINT